MALRVVACFVFFSLPAFFVRAQESAPRTRISVFFPVNRYVLLKDYANNAEALEVLDRHLDESNPAAINLVVIISAASPEGPVARNMVLSQRRGEALRSYILAQRPDLEDKIELRPVGEAWTELSIIDESLPLPERKKALRSHPNWRQIVNKKLPPLRYARLELTRESLSSFTLENPLFPVPQQTLQVPQLITETTKLPSIRPVIGVSTNLLYDLTYIPHYGLTSIPSFSLEYYPSRGHYTVGADVEWPMWRHYEDHRFMQVNNLTFWVRRYFRATDGRFRGGYLFASANAARYGIGWEAKGWEGEGLGASLGAGWKFLLGRRLFLDMGAAVGGFYSAYDPYVYGFDATGRYYYDFAGDESQFTPRRKRLMWFGPTRVYISLGVDLFNRKKK